MKRWRVALIVLWRSEPALPLVTYLLLAAAEVALIQLGGSSVDHLLSVKYGSYLALIPYLVGAWRIWLGGYVSWTLSVLWNAIGIVAVGRAAYHHPGVVVIGALVLSIATAALLFSPVVLRRTERRGAIFPSARTARS